MIILNKALYRIRCSRYQYVIKGGSMSNYSFDLLDEDRTGILDFIFEEITYPIEEGELKGQAVEKCPELTAEKAEETLKELKEIEVLIDLAENTEKTNLVLLTNREFQTEIRSKLETFEFQVEHVIELEHISKVMEESSREQKEPEEDLAERLKSCDYILLFCKDFQPDIFYKINDYSVKFDKKMIIAYLDGEEGVIVPILQPNKTGCYNDFELIRESTFHNLLDYQMMKEEKIKKKGAQCSTFYFFMMVDYAMVLLKNYRKHTYINSFAYSLDFERMVISKTRMLKFPKCPSCQGDKNLTHPFI